MAREFEIVGRREMPGLDAANPRAVFAVYFYRAAGDPNYADYIALPLGKDSDDQVKAALAAKEKSKAPGATRKVTID